MYTITSMEIKCMFSNGNSIYICVKMYLFQILVSHTVIISMIILTLNHESANTIL